MARQRRGGGFKPPELRGTLGTLLRTAAAQVGPLRDALERTAREGRSRFEDARASRRRSDALAELGEIVLDLIRQGEIDIGELPEVREIVTHLDEIDAGHDFEDAPDIAPPPARNRFDSRRRDVPDEDGAVSSKTWKPPAAKGAKPAPRVWRPPVGDAASDERAPFDVDTSVQRPSPPRKNPARKGGISFDDDDDSDLADYMHPDDVPPKSGSDE
jgi:hypothetical protein